MRKVGALDYGDIIKKENARKTIHYVEHYPGTCGKWIEGVRCSKPFFGPRTRKFCDEHSVNVRRGGKG